MVVAAMVAAVSTTAPPLSLKVSVTAAGGARLMVLGTHELQGKAEQRLVDILGARQIPYVSQRAYIAGNGGKISDAHWRHDAHWSPQGHTWAAQALLDAIAAVVGRPSTS